MQKGVMTLAIMFLLVPVVFAEEELSPEQAVNLTLQQMFGDQGMVAIRDSVDMILLVVQVAVLAFAVLMSLLSILVLVKIVKNFRS
ncbi:MAG TPA: hypothetical protein VJB87_03315 [Candidatus Nanoarchaeia archaeon]|nr:hypothetical protein [Candidatus Nanoarchaeia archaeon]